MSALIALASVGLFAQSLGFPGPGVKAYSSGSLTLDQHNNNNCNGVCGSDQLTVTLNASANSLIVLDLTWCQDSGCTSIPHTTDISTVSDGTNTYTANQFCTFQDAGDSLFFGRKQFTVASAAGGSLTITITFASGKGNYAEADWVSVLNSSGVDTGANQCGGINGIDPALTTAGNLASSNSFVLGGGRWGNAGIGLSSPTGYTNILHDTTNQYQQDYKITGTAGNTVTVTWLSGSSQDFIGSVIVLKP